MRKGASCFLALVLLILLSLPALAAESEAQEAAQQGVLLRGLCERGVVSAAGGL